jgi:fructuronate reductase
VKRATEQLRRLSAATLDSARAGSVATYERPRTASIAHLGVGAFARAHLAVYADDLLRLGIPAAIRGVSLHSITAQERLEPQDGYYTVVEREPGAVARLRVVGAFNSISTGAPAALAALTAPSTRVVSLTITEKGYDPEPEPEPGESEPPGLRASAAGVLALSLARWRESGGVPPVVTSLDNVSRNGDQLRLRVCESAARLDPSLPEWISTEVRFPNSVVDRMVPATTDEDISEIAERLGLVDLGAVTTEHHRSWIVEADDALEMFGPVGAELVQDIAPYEERKLWLLNGPHSALAYVGLLLGRATIAGAAADTVVRRFTQELVEDVLAVAEIPTALQARCFAEDALRRFANPNLRHSCVQVAADGSRKLPLRFGNVVSTRQRAGLDTTRFAVVAAIWIAAVAGVHLGGQALPPLDDPEANRLTSLPHRDLSRLTELALGEHFDEPFLVEVAGSLQQLTLQGARLFEDPL